MERIFFKKAAKSLAFSKKVCYNIIRMLGIRELHVCRKGCFGVRPVLLCLERESFLKEVKRMKQGIHPDYKQTVIKCACGNVIETGSTKENISIEICSKCHPFYTGKQKLVDTGGRVDKFRKRYGLAEK